MVALWTNSVTRQLSLILAVSGTFYMNRFPVFGQADLGGQRSLQVPLSSSARALISLSFVLLYLCFLLSLFHLPVRSFFDIKIISLLS